MSVFINNLNLQNFRNFEQKKISFNSKLVLFFGNNGVGKTNILEAISVLGRSSTLRGDDFEEMLRFNENSISNNFLISSQFNDHDYIDNMSVKFDKNLRKKIYQFNNEIATPKRLNELKNYLINFICLTPQIEQLFISGKSARRDYLDKIVCDLDLFHQNRLNDYQKLLKERLLILQKYRSQITVNKWLDIVENKIAEMGIAIAFARLEVIDFFNKAIESFNSNFPKAKLLVKGEVEDMAVHEKALNIENFYKQKLLMNRSKDLENFKTDFGVHRADFDALFLQKKSLATKSSTGEQKAIMISICLARAKILANYKNLPTIMIFDEIVSHLDEIKKHNLFDEINQTGLQCFFSATNSLALKNFQEISI